MWKKAYTKNVDKTIEENKNKAADKTVDNWKGSRLWYKISSYNTSGPHWNHVEGMIADVSDMVLSMTQNYSYMEPKVSPQSVLTASKSTPQHYYTKALEIFEETGYNASKLELDKNLIGRGCVEVLTIMDMDDTIKKKALNYLIFLKQKRCGSVKARGCADGRPQWEYISKDDWSSPTVSNYVLMCSYVMSAMEQRHVITYTIPYIFLQNNWPDNLEDCYLWFKTMMVDMVCEINSKYK